MFTKKLLCSSHFWDFSPADMGHRWPAPLQKHVGALLQRSQRYRVSVRVCVICQKAEHSGVCPVSVNPFSLQVHGGRGRSRQDRSFKQRTPQPVRQTTAPGNPCKNRISPSLQTEQPIRL